MTESHTWMHKLIGWLVVNKSQSYPDYLRVSYNPGYIFHIL